MKKNNKQSPENGADKNVQTDAATAPTVSPAASKEGKKAKRRGFPWAFVLRLLVVLAALAACALLFLHVAMDNDHFETTFYVVDDTRLMDQVRIVQLSDWHQSTFGEDNCDLVAQIQALAPNLILVTGDMVIANHADWPMVQSLMRALVDIAPTYFAYGNHEVHELLRNGTDVPAILEETGVELLSNEIAEIEILGNPFVIAGVTQFRDDIARYSKGVMDKFAQAEGYHILMSHYPENFDGYLEDYVECLAFAGHAHGGIVRLPFIGALYTPDQGLLPNLTEGVQTCGQTTLVISRGLESSPLRVNNLPELVVVDLR